MGLNQTDLNGNFSHSAFPGTCGLDVLDTDLAGNIISLATPGTVGGPTRVVPPSNYLLLTPNAPSSEVGSPITLTVTALDAAGDARPNEHVVLDVTTGPDAGSYTADTNARGEATFALRATTAGDEYAFASAPLGGDNAVSNSAHVTWRTPTVDGGGSGDGGDGGGGSTAGDGPVVSGLTPVEGSTVTVPTPVTVGSVTPQPGSTVVGWSLTPRAGCGRGHGQDPRHRQRFTGRADATGSDPDRSPRGEPAHHLRPDRAAQRHLAAPVHLGRQRRRPLRHAGRRRRRRTARRRRADRTCPSRSAASRSRSAAATAAWTAAGTANWVTAGPSKTGSFRVQVNRPLGDGGWEQYGCGSGLIFLPLCSAPRDRTSSPSPGPTAAPSVRSTSRPARAARSSTDRPSRLHRAPGKLFQAGARAGRRGASYLGDGNLSGGALGSGGVYDPQRFVLVAPDGMRYLLDRTTGLVKATDRNGNTVTVTADGVTSSNGPSIHFTRTNGRITHIDGPNGLAVDYGYENGDLTSVTDANQHVHGYGYQGHLLTKIDEPGAGPFRTLRYTPDGRLAGVDDGVNHEQTLDVDVDARTETVTSPDLKENVVTRYDKRGNPVRINRIFDGAEHVTTYEYNEFDVATKRTDPNGHTWSADYDDQGRLQTLTDARGKTTTFEDYSDYGVPRLIKDELRHATRLTFDPDTADLLSTQDAEGNTKSWTYYADGTVKTFRDGSTRADGTARTWSYTYQGGSCPPRGPGRQGAQLRLQRRRADAVRDRRDWCDDLIPLRPGRQPPVRDPAAGPRDRVQVQRARPTDRRLGRRAPPHPLRVQRRRPAQDRVQRGRRHGRLHLHPRDLVETVVNNEGDKTVYGYDGGGRLATVTDGEGDKTVYTYDGADQVTSTSTERQHGHLAPRRQRAGRRRHRRARRRDRRRARRHRPGHLGHGPADARDHVRLRRLGRLRFVHDALGHTQEIAGTRPDVRRRP